MHRFPLGVIICACLAASHASGQAKDQGLKTYLAGVTERGLALYAYDQAAWHGMNAFFALKPDTNGLTHFICTETPSGWLVTFPKWNETHDKLLIAYEPMESELGEYEARAYNPLKAADNDVTAEERALEISITSFQHPKRPYNIAIVPLPDGNLYVYLHPGQTKTTIWPLGDDVRCTISPDGKRIVATRQLHKSILEFVVKPNAVGG